MLVTLLVLVPFGLVLAVLSLPARRGHARPAAATAATPPPARRAAVPGPGVQPRDERQPFGTGDIVTAGEGHREAAKP